MVTHALGKTIYIDFDKIEASTISNCNKADRASVSRNGESNGETSRGEQLLSPHPTKGLGESPGDNDSRSKNLGYDQGNEADRMLEQAEALKMNVSLEDMLAFSDDE